MQWRQEIEEGFTGGVRIVSRRVIRPEPATSSPETEDETMHLTPWDLRMITVDHIQKGLLLPNPRAAAQLVDGLASSFARGLAAWAVSTRWPAVSPSPTLSGPAVPPAITSPAL